MKKAINKIQESVLSIKNIFLMFFVFVGLIVFSIISFILVDAVTSYEESKEISIANNFLADTRALNHALSKELLNATILVLSKRNGLTEDEIRKNKNSWRVIHEQNLTIFKEFKAKLANSDSNTLKNKSFSSLLETEKLLRQTGIELEKKREIHPDTLLDKFTLMFQSLDHVRTEILTPQDAGQFAIQQSLLIERSIRNLYDKTVIEGSLLTRVINQKESLDETLLNRLTIWREEAQSNRDYLNVYLNKIFEGQGFYKGDHFHPLEKSIKNMQDQFLKLDAIRKKIYLAYALNTDYDIASSDWHETLNAVLNSIKEVESFIILPAEKALIENVRDTFNQIEFILICSAMVLLILSILFYFLGKNVLKPIIKVTEQMSALAAGELQVNLPKMKRKDEIAKMVGALETFKDTALEARRLASFPEKNPDPIIELNENGIITYMNPSAKEKFPEMSVDAITHDLFTDFADLQMESLSESIVVVHERAVKEKFYERYTTFVKLEEKILIRVFVRDISIRKEKERALQETQEKADILLKALEANKTGIIIVNNKDTDKPIEYANDAFLELTEYSKENILGHSYEKWLDRSIQNNDKIIIGKIIETEGHLTKEVVLPKANGEEFWARLRLSPVHGEGTSSTAYIFIINDITEERKQKEEERKQQNMVSIAKMAGGMAHEINNALQPILGLSDTMQRKFEAEKQYEADKELAKIIYDYADYARNIVSDMLIFTKQDASNLEELNIVETIIEACEFVKQNIPENIKLKTSGLGFDKKTEKKYIVKANKTGLFQTVTNMAKNASHAIEDSGEIIIGVDKEELKINNEKALKEGQYIVLSLKDTGKGMDKETKSKVFEPFFSTKEIGKGTGLGMSVIYGIVKNWHGDIFVESELGKGTTFYIYLPILKEE
jgi:PAS domain S-box-containing protein